ncbi:hypothetical protein C464_15620 [Halorubrum coriense DSM 10284]|uniref:Uncharacterized protein n=1 Tax=Halorubrum coriense DSM 10284 TaxID=1227466 RepID=M0E924_9EURY|nr:hypothetical protein [Halorubrum coriense]ELZ44275.1 hypothetical protein C464_15620 [Halorubrum coriense DSM 10284]
MIDEPLPTPERTDSEPTPSAEPADGDGPGPTGRPEASAPTDAPNRAAEPPPDPDDEEARDPDDGESSDRGREPTDDGAGPDGSDRDAEGPNALEYRLERLRLLRAVVTLAVVVARLIRSL